MSVRGFQLFWTVVFVVNVVTFSIVPNMGSIVGGIAAGFMILRERPVA